MRLRITSRLFAMSALCAVGFAPALASADDVPPAVVEEDLEKKAMEKTKEGEKKEKRKDGWSKKLSFGANGSATSSSNVVGANPPLLPPSSPNPSRRCPASTP